MARVRVYAEVPKGVTCIAFDFEEVATFGQEVKGITDPQELFSYVQGVFAGFRKYLESLEPGDLLVASLSHLYLVTVAEAE